MPLQNPIFNRVMFGSFAALVIFYALSQIFPTDFLIVVLNGVFFGCCAALIVAFTPLLWYAILGLEPYDRVRQMTLGWALGWIVIIGMSSNSFYIRAADLPTTTLITTALWLYFACIAAIMQVAAPDFGLGIFHGRERKTLWISIPIAVVVALVAIYMQETNALEPFVKNALRHFAAVA